MCYLFERDCIVISIYLRLQSNRIFLRSIVRRNIVNNISRAVYIMQYIFQHQIKIILPHTREFLLQNPLSRGKKFSSVVLSNISLAFRPGYLSALKDARKVHARLKIRRTTGYASRGTNPGSPVFSCTFGTSNQLGACYRLPFDPFVICHRLLLSAVNYPEDDISFRRRH